MFWNRILGVFKLDVAIFENIEHASSATNQAAIVVAIVAALSGLGSSFIAYIAGRSILPSFLSAIIWTFAGWLLWSVVSYFVGTELFGGRATIEEMLRVIGFAYAPHSLAIIPCIGGVISLVWSLAASFVAIRQGLDLDDLKALFTTLTGGAVYISGYLFLQLILIVVPVFFNLSR